MTQPQTTGERQAGFRHFHEQLSELKQRLIDMSEKAEALIDIAVESLRERDAGKAEAVLAADHEESTFRVLLTHMMESAATISPGLQLLLVSRNLERVADLATNIGEDAVYLAEGKQIKHHFEERAQGKSVPPRS